MKKISIAVLTVFAVVGVARAEYKTVVSETVVVSEPVSTVANVMNFADNVPVIMTGNIIRPLGSERYVFRDKTGTITVQIDDNNWRGLEITEYDTVKLRGNVERAPNGIEVDVGYIEKL